MVLTPTQIMPIDIFGGEGLVSNEKYLNFTRDSSYQIMSTNIQFGSINKQINSQNGFLQFLIGLTEDGRTELAISRGGQFVIGWDQDGNELSEFVNCISFSAIEIQSVDIGDVFGIRYTNGAIWPNDINNHVPVLEISLGDGYVNVVSSSNTNSFPRTGAVIVNFDHYQSTTKLKVDFDNAMTDIADDIQSINEELDAVEGKAASLFVAR